MTDFRKIRGLRERLNHFPPFIVFNLSHVKSGRRYRRMTETEICAKSSLSSYRVEALCRDTNWDYCPVMDMLSFMDACGFDIMRVDRSLQAQQFNLRRGRPFCHLNSRQMVEFSKKLVEWRKRSGTA